MSDEGQPLLPHHLFKRVIWRAAATSSPKLETMTTWSLTGVAAILAFVLGNLESLSAITSPDAMTWFIILSAASLLAGALSKIFGFAVGTSLETVLKVESILTSKEGNLLMEALSETPRELVAQLAEPFLPPLSWFIRHSAKKGLTDYLAVEKRMIRMLCIQAYANFFHWLSATTALVVLAAHLH